MTAERPEPSDVAFIALDWGTTSARAYAVDASGGVCAMRSAPLGVQHLRQADFAQALAQLLGDWSVLRVPRLAAGMIGSRQGWVEAPYAACPAALEALGEQLAWTPGRELAIVPGLLYRDEHGVPDVMRGEETQLAGTLAGADETFVAVLPGTHSKWAYVERGRVAAFQTHMTGEVFAILLAHSILGRLADATRVADDAGAAFDAGVVRGLAHEGLLHTIFAARTLALTGELPPHQVSEWLSGCLIGSEIAAARRWLSDRSVVASTVRVIGGDALVRRYETALSSAGVQSVPGPQDAVVRGLIRIAQRVRLW